MVFLGSKNGPAAGGVGFKNKIYLKSSPPELNAQVLKIWYVAMASSPFPSLFK